MAKILVTGANGQLGSEIKYLSNTQDNHDFLFCSSKELDICDHKTVSKFIKINKIDTIINCAAYTAVDKAETEVDLANAVNHFAVENLAKIASERNLSLIHISTDYVFNGKNYKPYLETDSTDPQSIYGITKLAGEKAIIAASPKNSIIIRTSWVYSKFGNNFVKTMLRLASERDELSVVADQIGSPTNARDLAQVILEILPKLDNNKVETLHYSNDGVCSWYDFAYSIFEKSNVNIKLNPITSEMFPTPAKRPHYSLMSKEKIKKMYGIKSKHWATSLEEYLN